MARIAGVDIPPSKRVIVSLTYIHGIGDTTAKKILKLANIDGNKRTKDLPEDEVARLRQAIDRLASAKDIQEILAIQARYAQTQMQAYALQAQELGRLMAEAAQNMQPKG